MKFTQFIKSNLLFSLIIFFLVIVPVTVIPIYFAINKPDHSSPAPEHNQYIIPTRNPNELGFIIINTVNHVDGPKQFLDLDMFNNYDFNKEVDSGITNPSYHIQHKWIYDKNNEYSIERKILNTNKGYSQEELSALGKTNKPDTYLVNKIIASYDKDEPNLSKDVNMMIQPIILTTYGNYQNKK